MCKTSQQASLGYLREIDHGNGYVSRYGPLDSFAVRAGDWVQEGQLMLALEVRGGAQARTYYELRYWGKLVHPAMYTMDILKTKGQLDPPLLIGCDMDTADRRPKIVF